MTLCRISHYIFTLSHLISSHFRLVSRYNKKIERFEEKLRMYKEKSVTSAKVEEVLALLKAEEDKCKICYICWVASDIYIYNRGALDKRASLKYRF